MAAITEGTNVFCIKECEWSFAGPGIEYYSMCVDGPLKPHAVMGGALMDLILVFAFELLCIHLFLIVLIRQGNV